MKNCTRSEKYQLFFWEEVTSAQRLLTTIRHSETPFPNTNRPYFLNLVQRTTFPRKFLNSILMQEPEKGIPGKFVSTGKRNQAGTNLLSAGLMTFTQFYSP